jgi:broad specificity phosphatase PhoE
MCLHLMTGRTLRNNMKTMYLVRHGETTANAEAIVQGSDNELSAVGLAQANVLAERLRHLDFKHILVSDYVRTRQTVAPLLAYTTIEPVYTPLVRESKRPSCFVGFPRHGEEFLQYQAQAALHTADPNWHFADEENVHDILERVKEFLQHVETLPDNTLVVSHGRFIIFTIMYVLFGGKLTPEMWDGNMSTFSTTNTGISVLVYNEQKQLWALKTYNDHAHFAE